MKAIQKQIDSETNQRCDRPGGGYRPDSERYCERHSNWQQDNNADGVTVPACPSGELLNFEVSRNFRIAAQVRSLAKARRLRENRMLVEFIKNGMEAEKRKQQEFFDPAERFRNATAAEKVKRPGDQIGRMVFGN